MIERLIAWMRPHARMLALAGVSAAALGLLALVSYQLALARVPQHRAALERFVQAQSGFDVRFATLEVGLGWHGPEARFTRIEMREPGQRTVVVRAPKLTVAFDTWRILRNGQVQAARITLADAEIDLAPFLEGQRAAGGSAPRSDPLRLLERLPLLRIDVDGGTLRLPAASRGGLPHALRISRASVRRSDDSSSANALVLLPPHLGRSLFVALRVDGPLAAAWQGSGTLRINGRSLAFSAWRDLVPARWAPTAGNGDISGTLAWDGGALQKLEGELDLRAVAWPPGQGAGSLYRFPRARAKVAALRRDEGLEWHVTGLRLDDGRGESAAAALALEVSEGGRRITGESSRLPLAALAGLVRAGGLGPVGLLAALRTAGEVDELSFAWNAAAPPGERLQARVALEDLELTLLDRPATIGGVTARIEATDTQVRIHAAGSEARLALPALFARLPETVGLEARLLWSRETDGWSLASETLELSHPAISVRLQSELRRADEGPATLVLRGQLNPADVTGWKEHIALSERWPTLAALAAAAGGGRLESGDLALTGNLDLGSFDFGTTAFAGRITVQGLNLAAGRHWPELIGVGGELVWGGDHARLELREGQAAGLELVAAQGEWAAGSARPAQLDVELQGPLEQARRWLDDQSELHAEFADFTGLDLRGAARIALSFAPPQGARERGRWSVAATVEDGWFGFEGAAPPLEHVRGTVTARSGRLQSAQLEGEWLGGAAALQTAARARPSDRYRLVARGEAKASALYGALGLAVPRADGAADVELPWTARLRHSAGSGHLPAAWHIDFDASWPASVDELPPAFAWAQDQRRPLNVQLTLPQDGRGELALEAFGAARGVAALERRDGLWHVERAALLLGAGTPALPAEPRLIISGEAARLDPWATLAAFRLLEPEHGALPGSIDLVAQELLIGTRQLAPARLSGSFDAQALRLVLAGRDVAGSIVWPRVAEAPAPVELRFARLTLPAGPEVSGPVMGLLTDATDAELVIDDFEWGGRRLGRFEAHSSAQEGTLELRGIRIGQDAFRGEGRGSCSRTPRRCEWTLSFESPDVGAALQSLGFATTVQGGQGTVALDVAWEPTPERGVWAALSGRISAQLEDGLAAPAAVTATGTELPLLAAPAAFLVASGPDATFESLAGRYDLRGGEAVTSDLRIVTRSGELEVSGRIDFAARLYELDATLTAGGSASALHRMREERSVAAAIAAMRELVGASAASRTLLSLRGGWDAPIVASTIAGK